MPSLQHLTTHKSQKRSVKIVVDETKDRIGYASKRTTCHSTAPRCLADGSFRLKLVDSQTEGKKSLFVTALMKTFVLQCVYREHICSPDIKLIVQGTVLKTLIGIKCIFSTAYLYKKSLGNFFYHLTTLSRNKESKWNRTVRLDTLIYRYYFSLFPAQLIYQFGFYMPRIIHLLNPNVQYCVGNSLLTVALLDQMIQSK